MHADPEAFWAILGAVGKSDKGASIKYVRKSSSTMSAFAHNPLSVDILNRRRLMVKIIHFSSTEPP